MVRAVKTKPVRSLAKGQSALLFPGPTMAEPWEVWVFGGKGDPELVQVCSTPIENRLRKNSTLALPVAQVFCLPLWLNETDTKQIAASIPLQIELRGLQPRSGASPVFDFTVVAQEETRSLIVVGVLPHTLPAELHVEAYEHFELSARCLPLVANALTLWREHDRLCLAVMRGTSLIYYQALTDNAVNTRVVQDISSVLATLKMQGIVPDVQSVVAWVELTAEELAALKAALKLPAQVEERPDPMSPPETWKLTPNVVTEARRARENQRWITRGLVAGLVLYLGFVAWLTTNYVLTTMRVAELRKWQAAHADALGQIDQARAAWKDLAPVVEVNKYPLALLHQAQNSIPADQLHLTLYETNGTNILLQGEAKNVAAAFQFKTKLSSDPYFSDFNFDMQNPRPLPNDLASFQINATRSTISSP